MKKIEKPFGTAAYSTLMDISAKYEIACRRYDDLCLLRDKVSKGQLTPDLYDFINADKSLEHLFNDLPRPSAEVACEALTAGQLIILDATIADEALNLKELAAKMWESIRDWLMQWFDRNIYLRNELRYLKSRWSINGNIFGDSATFAGTQVLAYRHDAWEHLLKAAQDLNDINDTLVKSTPDNFANAIEEAKVKLPTPLAEFGKHMDERYNIIQGQVKYLRENNTCGVLRWYFQSIGDYLEKSIQLLGNEIEHRRELNKLETLFKKSDVNDRHLLIIARSIVFNAKDTAMAVARSVKVMLNQVARSNASQYRINNPNG